jgi:hypothetical protein
MENRWSVLRLGGLGFVFGSVVSLVRALVQEAGTALTPGDLLSLVFFGGIGGAALLAVVATARNFFVNRSRT